MWAPQPVGHQPMRAPANRDSIAPRDRKTAPGCGVEPVLVVASVRTVVSEAIEDISRVPRDASALHAMGTESN